MMFERTIRSLVLLMMVAIITNSIRISPLIPPHTRQCYYQHFYHESKYRFFLAHKKSDAFVNFNFELVFVTNDGEKILFSQASDNSIGQRVQLHKFASEEGIHGFCVSNNESYEVIFQMKLDSGMQLMQLDLTAGHDDTRMIEDSINILKQQYKQIQNSLMSVQGARAITQQVFQMMSSKTLGFGMIGVGVIILINIIFYRLIKKSLQDKKRI